MDTLKSLSLFLENMNLNESQLAYGSTILISVVPFLILFLFRVENTGKYRNELRLGLSFASGGLLGDAFLHLIPHSMVDHHDHHHEHHDHSHSHSHHDSNHHEHEHNHHNQTLVGLYIIIGIILFFVIEKFVHMIKGGSHAHSHHKHGHDHHHHSHFHPSGDRKEKLSDPESDEYRDSSDENQTNKKNRKPVKHQRKHKPKSAVTKTRYISGILNLIADFLHNFTDGLAIGATFAHGQGLGLITTVNILLHEIPHEIGDYAILIQAGYRRRDALLLQLVTAIGALMGTAIGLRYGTLEHASQIMLPITAGGFIYIATVTVIPDLLEGDKISHKQSFFEIVSIFVGVAMMYWIALNE